ncbi:E3 ubiquitin/ISG15 ligase TRIM25-like [Hyla sarda]|uniref:E3 ubiquitin/ISG15 ligase TRIM25-like n=1 Tax=Hyla sarda TaxID=327740 RepID=UPI0024C3580A|nr:E3 ubiquitin/ISG15 ligase TRIM25-like [Hyla sarda]XP_056390685.1 E3 ubiquitin/ISG15 ligase TRIM25-like [Hyla sarda]
MASADVENELKCPICLNLYTDPLSLRCGHNFCRSCIVQVLDTQDRSEEYLECPSLKRQKLDNVVEKTKIFCSYCINSPVAAVKSCLQCENSLCDDHLKVHNKTMDHIIAEPTNYFSSKKCFIHKKVLEYYCLDDAACLCVSCVVENHKKHQVELLDEASAEKKLRKNLNKLNSQKAEIQTRVQNLHDHQRNIKERATDKRENISKLFMSIKEQLEMAEKKALSEITRQEEKIVSQISDLIKKQEIEEDELSRKMCHLEEMCNVTDPIRLLQESDITVCGQGDGADTKEDGGKIKSEDDSHVQVSDTQVQDDKTDPKTVLHESDQEMASSDESVATEAAPVGDLPMMADDLNETAEDLDEVVISMMLYRSLRDIITHVTSQLGFCVPDIFLDVNTAEENLFLSKDLKTVKDVDRVQNRHKSSGSFFDCPQVLSRCGLSSGRHYWEVEWNKKGIFSVGMSYPSIKKKGRPSDIAYSDKSWCLTMEDREFSVSHNRVTKTLDSNLTCPTLGVFLDYEAGRLSFYEMCDPIRHLHTFTASFTEPLHAIFSVNYGASLKITG